MLFQLFFIDKINKLKKYVKYNKYKYKTANKLINLLNDIELRLLNMYCFVHITKDRKTDKLTSKCSLNKLVWELE